MHINPLKSLLLCGALLLSSVPLQAAYGFNRTVTINHLKVPNTDQTNMPMLFSGTYAYLKTTGNGGNVTSSSGYDIIFAAASNCSSPLDFQLDTYDATTGAVNFWIRVPTISHTVDTDIYICYGDSGVTTSQENIGGTTTGVFPTNRYGNVFHFGSTTSFTGTDSTLSVNHLSPSGSPNPTGSLSGKIGAAGSFTPNSQATVLGGGFPSGVALRTTSFWFKLATVPSGYVQFFGYGNTSVGGGVWSAAYNGTGSGAITMVYGGLNPDYAWTADTNWHYCSIVMPVANSANVLVYMDGVALVGSGLGSTALNTAVGSGFLGVGSLAQLGINFLDGLVDEARNKLGADSQDTIVTQYNNQNDPATFYTISGGVAPIAASANVLGAQLQGQGFVY